MSDIEPVPWSEQQLERLRSVYFRLEQDAAEKGLHYGIRNPPRCACCKAAWPCPTERARKSGS